MVSLEDLLYDSELGREMLRHKIVMLLQFLFCNFYERWNFKNHRKCRIVFKLLSILCLRNVPDKLTRLGPCRDRVLPSKRIILTGTSLCIIAESGVRVKNPKIGILLCVFEPSIVLLFILRRSHFRWMPFVWQENILFLQLIPFIFDANVFLTPILLKHLTSHLPSLMMRKTKKLPSKCFRLFKCFPFVNIAQTFHPTSLPWWWG